MAGTKKKPRILPPRHAPQDKTKIAWLLRPIANVMPTDINAYITDRPADVEAVTVDREIDPLSQVITWCTETLRIHLHVSPLVGVKHPSYYNKREQRLKPDEEQRHFDAAREEDRLLAAELKLDTFRAQVAAIPDVHLSTRKRRLRALRLRRYRRTGHPLFRDVPQVPAAHGREAQRGSRTQVPPGLRPALRSGAVLAVSLEPPSGAPLGVPTGSIIAKGVIQL